VEWARSASDRSLSAALVKRCSTPANARVRSCSYPASDGSWRPVPKPFCNAVIDGRERQLWVIFYRSNRICLPDHVRFAPKATESLRSRKMTQRAISGCEQAQQNFLSPTGTDEIWPAVRGGFRAREWSSQAARAFFK